MHIQLKNIQDIQVGDRIKHQQSRFDYRVNEITGTRFGYEITSDDFTSHFFDDDDSLYVEVTQ